MSSSVILYTKPGCHLCEDVEAKVRDVRNRVPFDLEIVDILGDPRLKIEHGFDIPVVIVNGAPFSKHFLDDTAFENYMKEVSTTQ